MEKKYFEFSGSITQNNIQGNNKVKFDFNGKGKEKEIQQKNNWFFSMLKSRWFLIGIIILLLGAIIFLHFQTITDSNDISLVLAFVGILATFVVISNYAQVIEIRNEFKAKIQEIKNEVDVKIKKISDENIYYTEYKHFLDFGRKYIDEGEYLSAFRCYFRALNLINHISNDKINDVQIISNIEYLKVIMLNSKTEITSNDKSFAISVLNKSGHDNFKNDFIELLQIKD